MKYVKLWSDFKAFVDSRPEKVSLQWFDIEGHYHIYLVIGRFTAYHVMKKIVPASSDQQDFEDNYKSKGNGRLDEPKDFAASSALGAISGIRTENISGGNAQISLTKYLQLWGSGTEYIYETSASAMYISSTDVNDTSTGTGARTVEVRGLDSTYKLQTETVTMNGTTAVTSTKSYISIYDLTVKSSGSNNKNHGVIEAKSTTSANTICQMAANSNRSNLGVFTVEAGKTALVTGYWGSALKDKEVAFRLSVRPFGEVFQFRHEKVVYQSNFYFPFNPPMSISEKSDIEISAISLVGSSYQVFGGFDLIIEES